MKFNKLGIPQDGWDGFKQFWKEDMLAGFWVYLLALPLSLGIAKASEFPPVMGVLTAIIGGVIVSFLSGSKLTIKGPAAGLIVIVAGAVHDFGGGETGWKLALGTIVVAGLVQILFGVFKLGSLSDFFPSSAVHGMLAAIGIIIFAKQFHVLMGIDPKVLQGMNPFELLARIPESILNMDHQIGIIGILSLMIVFGLPRIKNKIVKKIPSPIVVLALTIPLAMFFDLKGQGPSFALVEIGSLLDSVNFNVDFSAFKSFIFVKYVIMFALVGSIESLLTVKAIDTLDPFRRRSDYNKDLVAVGIGNTLAGILGGLPMISEVARSSANVNSGGKTRWANFFHGLFLLIALLLFVPIIEMIPNAALAALLIGVGYRLASPKEFIKTYKIGSEQLLVFVATIIATLATDLLIGIGVGIATELVLHIYYGASITSLFKAQVELKEVNQNQYFFKIKNSATFGNYLGVKRYFEKLPLSAHLIVDFSDAKVIDHTFMEQLHVLEVEMQNNNGKLELIGLESHINSSDHPLSAKRKIAFASKNQNTFNSRQRLLLAFAESNKLNFYPKYLALVLKFKDFTFFKGQRIKSQENLLNKRKENIFIEFSDIKVEEMQRLTKYEFKMTNLMISGFSTPIPNFTLEEEGLLDVLLDKAAGNDIDFEGYPKFSKRYYLKGDDTTEIRKFFDHDIITYLEERNGFYIEVRNNKMLIFKEPSMLTTNEMKNCLSFAEGLVELIEYRVLQRARSYAVI